MLPELKKAIIKFVPDYFSWDQKRQEQYRVDTPEEDAFKIRQFLLRELFDISVANDDELEEARRAMNEMQCLKLNATLLPIKGIGEDFFYLNEVFGSQKNCSVLRRFMITTLMIINSRKNLARKSKKIMKENHIEDHCI